MHRTQQKLFLFLFSLILFTLPVQALGAENEKKYTIAVPKDWDITTNASSSIYTHPKELCAITVSMAPHQDVSMRELGITFYETFNGTKAKGDDDGMTFSMKHEKLQVILRLTIQASDYMLVSAQGTCPNFQEILRTITPKNHGARAYPLLNYYTPKTPSS